MTYDLILFMQAVEEPQGDLDLLQHLLDGANVEVDESSEERKGGAGDLAKAFLSAGDKQLAIIVHVPEALAKEKGVGMDEWIAALTEPVKDHVQVVDKTGEVAKLVVPGDADAGRFPLKMRDDCTAAGFTFLRSKGLIPADESSDDDVDYAAAAGVEW